jgi:hypothetical protein
MIDRQEREHKGDRDSTAAAVTETATAAFWSRNAPKLPEELGDCPKKIGWTPYLS